MKKISLKIIAFVAILLVGVVITTMLWPEKPQRAVEESRVAEQPKRVPTAAPQSTAPKRSIDIPRAGIAEPKKKAGPLVTAAAPIQQQGLPMASRAKIPLLREGQEPPIVEQGRPTELPEPYLRQPYTPMLEQREPQPVSQEHQRHIERYQVLQENQRLQYSKEQQEQKKNELLSRLPARYRELLEKIDEMKKAELEKRRQSPPKILQLDYLKKQIIQEPDQGTVAEQPPSIAEEKKK